MEKPLSFKTIRIAEKSDKWSIEKLQAYQFERLKTLFTVRIRSLSVLQKEFDESGFHPSQMTSPDDMKVLPVIDKSVLIRNNGDIQSTYKFDKFPIFRNFGFFRKALALLSR